MNEELQTATQEEVTQDSTVSPENQPKEANTNDTQPESMAELEDHFDDANPWNLVLQYQQEKRVLHLTVDGVVNGGVIAKIEGLRGFIPASKLSLSYVENLESFLTKEIDVQVIEVNQAENRLILSARDLLLQKERAELRKKVEAMEIGSVVEGTVESIQPYGAFIRLDNGLSGLVHISQVANKHLKTLKGVLKKGDSVTAKLIAIKDGKLSLSMKALLEPEEDSQEYEKVNLPKAEEIGTNLGDLFKNFKL